MPILNAHQQGDESKDGSRNKIDSGSKGKKGKKFEKDIQNSVPNDIFCYRLKNDGMKFANVCNICEFLYINTHFSIFGS